jgi:hypothetical protein
MPSTVASVFRAAGVRAGGVALWGRRPGLPPAGTPGTGIYVVALTPRVNRVDRSLANAPIAAPAIDVLLNRRADLTLDGTRPTRQQLMRRLGAFWLPDETVLYIGLAGPRGSHAGRELPHRVGEYAKTRLGAKRPHSGGWPLLTLSCLRDLYVHYAYCTEVDAVERAALAQFGAKVSEATRTSLHDSAAIMPFANLEAPRGNRKAHGVRGARGVVAAGAPTPW